MTNTVVYIQCPNCRKGYTGDFITITHHEEDCGEHTAGTLSGVFIKTCDDIVNLVEKQTCYNCGYKYVPVKSSRIKRMEAWVANKLMNMKVG